MNAHEQLARLHKADKIAEALRSAGITADQMRTADDSDWLRAATGAGVRPASVATREMVIEKLARLEPKRPVCPRCKGTGQDCATCGRALVDCTCSANSRNPGDCLECGGEV